MSERAVGLEKWSVQTAMARRTVGILEDMETMCASPDGVRCVNFLSVDKRLDDWDEYERIEILLGIAWRGKR
jgi:hypothetical protein